MMINSEYPLENPNYTYHTFPNIGFTMTKFLEEKLIPIKQEINKIQNNFLSEDNVKHNKHLAGNIEKQFLLKDSKEYMENLIYPHLLNFDAEFDFVNRVIYLNAERREIVLDAIWVNFQKKYEFNPIHIHQGVISFVLWIQVPYIMENEKKQLYSFESDWNSPACFYFHYTNSLGQIRQHQLPVDKTYENVMIVFPASMSHGVYPFVTSDDYRISVSGNFKFKV